MCGDWKYMHKLPANDVLHHFRHPFLRKKKKTLEVDQTSYPRSKAEGVLPRS